MHGHPIPVHGGEGRTAGYGRIAVAHGRHTRDIGVGIAGRQLPVLHQLPAEGEHCSMTSPNWERTGRVQDMKAGYPAK